MTGCSLTIPARGFLLCFSLLSIAIIAYNSSIDTGYVEQFKLQQLAPELKPKTVKYLTPSCRITPIIRPPINANTTIETLIDLCEDAIFTHTMIMNEPTPQKLASTWRQLNKEGKQQ